LCTATGCAPKTKIPPFRIDYASNAASIKADKEAKKAAEDELSLALGLAFPLLLLAAALWSYRERLPCCKKDDSQVAPLSEREGAQV
jgi:hypothetical protein